MKHLLLTLLFASLTTASFAQFRLGLSAGANRSFWNWKIKSLDHNIDYLPSMGWRAAILGEWQITPLLGIQAALGTQVKVNKLPSSILFESDLLSGNIPRKPRYFREHYKYWEGSLLMQVSPIKNFRYTYLLAGGTMGRLGKAWNTLSGTEDEERILFKNPIDTKNPNWNRNALAADFGIGGNIPLDANSSIKIEGRFQYGLSNLSSHDNVDASVSSLFFNMGYLHRL